MYIDVILFERDPPTFAAGTATSSDVYLPVSNEVDKKILSFRMLDHRSQRNVEEQMLGGLPVTIFPGGRRRASNTINPKHAVQIYIGAVLGTALRPTCLPSFRQALLSVTLPLHRSFFCLSAFWPSRLRFQGLKRWERLAEPRVRRFRRRRRQDRRTGSRITK